MRLEVWKHQMSSTFLGLLFLLPFCNVARLPPNAAFWGEWMAVLLCCMWAICQGLTRYKAGAEEQGAVGGKISTPPGFSVTVMVLISLALMTLGQTFFNHARFASEALLAGFILLFAALASHLSGAYASNGRVEVILRPVAWGILVALWLNAVVVVAGIAGWDPVRWTPTSVELNGRNVGLIGQANQLGILAVLGIAAAVALRFDESISRLGVYSAMIVGSIVCASTGSRIAVVAFFIAAVGYAVIARSQMRFPSSRIRWCPRGLVAAVSVFLVVQVLWIWFSAHSQQTGTTAWRTGDAGRTSMLIDGLRLWLAHPLWGVGYGNFAWARLFELEGPLPAPHADHAHNLVIQLIAEWGFLGALPVVFALTVLMVNMGQLTKSPAVSVGRAYFSIFVLIIVAYSFVEFPLWLANFLLPFAVVAGVLPQPKLRIQGKRLPSSLGRSVTVVGGVLILSGLVFAAWDYSRSQTIAMKMNAQIGAGKYVLSNVSYAEAAEVAVGTLFPIHAEIMLARTLPLDADFAEHKLNVASRALASIVSSETIARYVIHLMFAGRADEGLVLLASLRSRNAAVHAGALALMEVLAEAHPSIALLYREALLGHKP